MQNIKYHALNIASVVLFSLITAFTINQFIKYTITPDYKITLEKSVGKSNIKERKDFSYYNDIIESGFFKIADVKSANEGDTVKNAVGSPDELSLLGTITGPSSIARALIKKKAESTPMIFALYKINNDIDNNVYGYTLTRIDDYKVYLTSGSSKYVLELFDKKNDEKSSSENTSVNTEGVIKKTLSRAEIKQKVLNNMDNALRGLRAGPYRVNGQVEGYRLITVRPYNILYKMGARNGDIVKRINGKKIDSTEKLYKMWDAFKNESRITTDIERGGKIITFEFDISE